MTLYGYNTAAGTLGKDVQHWNQEDLNGNLPFQWLDNPLAGYSEIHTIELINTYGWRLGKDYKFVRDAIRDIVKTGGSGDEEAGFNTLTSEQKIIASQLKVGKIAQRIAVLGYTDLIAAMIIYKTKTHESRNVRRVHAEVLVRNLMDQYTMLIMAVADTPFKNYDFYGIDGMAYDDIVPGISDYINAINGFEGIGLRDQAYTPSDGSTLDSFCDRLIDILIKGIY